MEKIRLGKTECMVSWVSFGGIPIMRIPKAEAVIQESIDPEGEQDDKKSSIP